MICKSWMNHSVIVDGHRCPSPHSDPTNAKQLAGAIRHLLPSRRDREVPYGMKGGEHNGHEEEIFQEVQ